LETIDDIDARAAVRDGYDAIATDYLQARDSGSADVELLRELEVRLPAGARVLDLGCGAGIPVAQRLVQNFDVTGLDFSTTQVELARQNVPLAEFRCADMVEADLGEECYEAVCSFYAIIHVPRDHHRLILTKIHRSLVPGGLALLCLGAQDLEEDYADDYHGRPMYWSHFDAPTNLALMAECGFAILEHWIVTDASCPETGHLFVLARPFMDNRLLQG
jgi:SAM-dependent methyltransferase